MPLSFGLGVGLPFVRSSGAVAPFDPNALPSPIVWLDWGDPSQQYVEGTPPGTTLAGDLTGVGTSRDKTSNARHCSQAVGTQRPTRDAVASPSVLTCDGGDRLFSAAFGPIAQPFTFCVVSDNLVNNSAFYDNGTAGTRILAQRGAAATTVQMFAGATLAATCPDMATRAAYLFVYNGANSQIWRFDGTNFVQLGATGNAGTNTLGDLRIFGNTAAFLNAVSAAELFAFGAIPSAQNRADIGAYLKPKWSL